MACGYQQKCNCKIEMDSEFDTAAKKVWRCCSNPNVYYKSKRLRAHVRSMPPGATSRIAACVRPNQNFNPFEKTAKTARVPRSMPCISAPPLPMPRGAWAETFTSQSSGVPSDVPGRSQFWRVQDNDIILLPYQHATIFTFAPRKHTNTYNTRHGQPVSESSC